MQWRKSLAERRMLEALDVWQSAEMTKRPFHEIAKFEANYLHEALMYAHVYKRKKA